MIGHVFTSSGATCLAVAPSVDRVGDYQVLAQAEGAYAVAIVDVESLPTPHTWLSEEYFDSLDEAIDYFGERTGLVGSPRVLRRQVERALSMFDHPSYRKERP